MDHNYTTKGQFSQTILIKFDKAKFILHAYNRTIGRQVQQVQEDRTTEGLYTHLDQSQWSKAYFPCLLPILGPQGIDYLLYLQQDRTQSRWSVANHPPPDLVLRMDRPGSVGSCRRGAALRQSVAGEGNSHIYYNNQINNENYLLQLF